MVLSLFNVFELAYQLLSWVVRGFELGTSV